MLILNYGFCIRGDVTDVNIYKIHIRNTFFCSYFVCLWWRQKCKYLQNSHGGILSFALIQDCLVECQQRMEEVIRTNMNNEINVNSSTDSSKLAQEKRLNTTQQPVTPTDIQDIAF